MNNLRLAFGDQYTESQFLYRFVVEGPTEEDQETIYASAYTVSDAVEMVEDFISDNQVITTITTVKESFITYDIDRIQRAAIHKK